MGFSKFVSVHNPLLEQARHWRSIAISRRAQSPRQWRSRQPRSCCRPESGALQSEISGQTINVISSLEWA